MKKYMLLLVSSILIVRWSCLADTHIKNDLDYPIKVDVDLVWLVDAKGEEVSPGQEKVIQTGAFYEVAVIKGIRVWVNEGTGYPEKPFYTSTNRYGGFDKEIHVHPGPADLTTGERDYIVDVSSRI